MARIFLIGQPRDEWGDPEDRTDATLQLDMEGRKLLIEALLNCSTSIQCIGELGGQYTLNIEWLEDGAIGIPRFLSNLADDLALVNFNLLPSNIRTHESLKYSVFIVHEMISRIMDSVVTHLINHGGGADNALLIKVHCKLNDICSATLLDVETVSRNSLGRVAIAAKESIDEILALIQCELKVQGE